MLRKEHPPKTVNYFGFEGLFGFAGGYLHRLGGTSVAQGVSTKTGCGMTAPSALLKQVPTETTLSRDTRFPPGVTPVLRS